MKKLLLGAVALFAAGAVAMPQSAMAAHTDSRTYVAAGGDLNILDLSSNVPGGPGIGGAIFDIRAGEGHVAITVSDAAAAANVGWYYQFDDDDPLTDSTDFGDVCGKTKTLTIPAGKNYTSVGIFVDQAFNELVCGKPTPGTTGTINANFTL